MDGFTLAYRIGQHPQLTGAMIMMLTSAGQRGDAVRCREVGIAAYLTKPIAQSELWRAIQMVLDRQVSPAERVPLVTRHAIRESRRSLHVLLAEDNVVNQKLALLLLQKQGHRVVAVGNGKEALAAVAQQPFDLVLMDVQMPIMDGLEATMAIREGETQSAVHLPIVAMTAHAMQGDRERCLVAGMDDYISKPIKAGELEAALDRVLQHAGVVQALKAEPPIDLSSALSSMDGNTAVLVDVLRVFLEYYPKAIAELQTAIAAGDAAGVERVAHSLKGAVSTFGAQTASTLASELEMMGRQGQLDTAPAVLRQLAEALERIKALTAEPGWQEHLGSPAPIP
jgi:CheY-like chemotaxis protein